jgi:CysZ protein
LPSGDAWYWTILRTLLWAVGSALLAILFLLTFTVVGNVIAGPFNDLLSEKVEELVRGVQSRPSPGLREQIGAVGRTALEEVKRLAFYLLGSVVLLLWNLIPGMGQMLYAVSSGIWTLLFLALEFGDYYLLRHWIRFRSRWSHIWSQRWASLGFGAGAALLLMVPLLNLLLIPGAVAGGTLLWIRLAPPEG